MPPRKTPSKAVSANEANGARLAPPTSTAKRTMSSYRIRQDNNTPGDASLSGDELDAPVGAGDTDEVGAEKEVVLDEIVVSGTPQNAKTIGVGPNSQSFAVRTPAEASKMVRRSSRASSISQSGSSTLSPSGRGVMIKKQDFVVSIAADNDGEPDELSDPPTSKRQRVDFNSTKRVAARKSRSKWDNHEEMLTDPNSPLVKAKLRELLCSPKAWEILTQEEREQILAKFPDDAEILEPETHNARPDIAALRNNNNFRHDVARYQEGLSKGFHDPEWIQQAQAAHRSRQLGFYDEFKASDFEERWDMPMPQQTQAGQGVNGKGSHDSPKEQLDEASTEAKAAVSPEDPPGHRQGTDLSARPQSPDVPHNNPADDSIRDRKDNPESVNDSKARPSDNMPEASHKKRDKSPETKNEEESAQPKAVATPDSTEMNRQEIGDDSRNSQVPSIRPLPDAMEGVEQQSEEKTGTTNTQEDLVMENASAPVAVTSTHIAGSANETQQLQYEKDAPGGGKAAKHQIDDK